MSESVNQSSSRVVGYNNNQTSDRSAVDICCELDVKLAKLESDHQRMLVVAKRLKSGMETMKDQLHDAEVRIAYLLGIADARLAYR